LATDPTLEIGPGARLLSTATDHQAFLIQGGLRRFPRVMNWFGLPATYAAAFAEAKVRSCGRAFRIDQPVFGSFVLNVLRKWRVFAH